MLGARFPKPWEVGLYKHLPIIQSGGPEASAVKGTR